MLFAVLKIYSNGAGNEWAKNPMGAFGYPLPFSVNYHIHITFNDKSI
jgi:hypothetical protein